MNLQDILQAISTVGFPIVCVGYMAWRDYKHDDDDKEEREKTQNMLLDFSKNIQENTILLKSLAEIIEKYVNKKED